MRTLPGKRRRIMTVGVVILLLVAVIVGISARILSSTTKKPPTLSATSTPTSQKYPNFKGIYQFGSNSSTLASNPYIAGAHLGYYWSQLEPQKGQYNWSAIDQGMAPWVSLGKKVILRVPTSGYTSWTPPYSQSGTPQWVYKLGVASVTETDGSVLPAYWSPVFLQNFADFVHAFALRYDGNPNVAFIDIGLGIGGEAKVDSHNSNPNQLNLWKNIGYTNPLWWNAVQSIIQAYTSNFSKTPLAVMPDKVFMEKTSGYSGAMLLDYAVQHGLWLQDNGLAQKRTLSPQFMQVPHPEEQIGSTTATGDSLRRDIQRALDLGGNYIMVFSTDLKKSSNQATLKWAASKVVHP